ncbi:MAG TPA: non-ribosomal peptide synthetase [Burkholderiales bacterium]|jgi:acyl-CoA synthetase (AMP-forming)/AMP-acid ligase II
MDDQPRTLGELAALRARSTPKAPALLAPHRAPLTYEALHEVVQRTAGALMGCGAVRGARVAVALPNGPDMAVAVLGVTTVATCAPLNPEYGEAEWRFSLSDLEPKALLLPAGQCAGARKIAEELGIRCLDAHWSEGSPAGAFDIVGAEPTVSAGGWEASEDDVAIVLHTSGTTSRPKLVPLTHRNILRSARNIAAGLNLASTDRCLNLMPLFHVHGLVAALCASLWAGASVACTPGMRAGGFLAWLEALEPTWYTAVPTIHEAVLRELTANGATAHRLRMARSSSAALPKRLALALESALGVPVVEAYGMTEAAHQIAANPLPPGRRKPGTVGRPCGPEVGIMDQSGGLLSNGATGEIVVRGENVMSGYEGDAEVNRAAFVNGWFRTGDAGHFDEDGYLTVSARLKEVINRGGEKVSPGEVEQALYEHEAVQQAVAFAVPHPTLGEDVAAAVVLRAQASLTSEALRRFLVGRVAEAKVPGTVVFVEQLPKGPTGKLQRIGLAERLADRLAPRFVSPRTPMEILVAETFAAVLGNERIGVHDNFFALGGDSLRGNQVLARLRAQIRADVPLMTLFTYPTVAELAREIEAAEQSRLLRALEKVEQLDDAGGDRLLQIARQRRGNAG